MQQQRVWKRPQRKKLVKGKKEIWGACLSGVHSAACACVSFAVDLVSAGEWYPPRAYTELWLCPRFTICSLRYINSLSKVFQDNPDIHTVTESFSKGQRSLAGPPCVWSWPTAQTGNSNADQWHSSSSIHGWYAEVLTRIFQYLCECCCGHDISVELHYPWSHHIETLGPWLPLSSS
jgi:hypothetical protein